MVGSSRRVPVVTAGSLRFDVARCGALRHGGVRHGSSSLVSVAAGLFSRRPRSRRNALRIGLRGLHVGRVRTSGDGSGVPGHPERIVDLELKAQRVTDPTELARRRTESLGLGGDAGKSELLDGCIGRHITDRALNCVRNAETATDITEHCLQ